MMLPRMKRSELFRLPVVERLLASDDPSVVFKIRRDLLGEPETSVEMQKLRGSIAAGERARALLGHRQADGTITTHAYRKWQGPHWTLVQLEMIGYPPGDEALLALRDQVYAWLLGPRFLRFPATVVYPDQPDRIRRCASQEGNAVWCSLRLGLEDERTPLLVDRLIEFQWPDGGWNCDKRPEARTSSFVETLIPMRALHAYGRAHKRGDAVDAADRAAEFLLRRELLKRRRDGVVHHRFTSIQFPIRFYDVLMVLTVMAEMGRVGDPRCDFALELLEGKRLPDGGYAMEERTARTVDGIATRGTYADWGPGGKTRSNQLVTAEATAVMHAAGRLS